VSAFLYAVLCDRGLVTGRFYTHRVLYQIAKDFISRASSQKGVSTKLLIYRTLNYDYLVSQMCINSVHTPKCSSLYLCVEQHQHYALVA
jgi:hypothetical protein